MYSKSLCYLPKSLAYLFIFFFFNDTATTEIYTLSLHDALPISPHLMQASGLGPGGLLTQHQVPVAVDLAGVGENLQDHLQLRTVYRVRGAQTVNTLYRNWITRGGMGLQYLLLRSGPMTMPPSTLGAFAKSDPALASPDLEWHVQPLSLAKFGEPLHPFGAITP